MAHGFLCRRCGWQETAHKAGRNQVDNADASRLIEGYKKTLDQCLDNFKYNDEDAKLLPELQEMLGHQVRRADYDEMGFLD